MIRKKSNPTHIPKPWMGIAIRFVILTILLNSCAFDFPAQTADPANALNEADLATSSVNLQFIVNIPAAISEGQGIVLQVLDEVTGLAYNPKLYILSPLSPTQYSVTLPFQTGSVVKYRYIRIGSASEVPEATLFEGEVRYRMVIVAADSVVTDTVQMWLDTPAPDDPPTGKVTGQVVSVETGAPLADILISIAGLLTVTDANGNFSLAGIAPGVQNIVFYAIDGAFEPFQQGAVIAASQVTPVNVSLKPRQQVEVTFQVTPPNDALGVPIYLAGNIAQLGNTFTDLGGGMSVDPKRLPMLTQQDNGTSKITLSLYAGMDLRYKFTLGDGYWNAERSSVSGSWLVHQLIVPNHDVTIQLTIDSWRSAGTAPITFEVSIPPETSTGDEIFIQFNNGVWTSPLPLWPLGGGNYLYILFSPLDQSIPISYRFCRNEACDEALNAEALISNAMVQPAETAQTVQLTLTNWTNWQIFTEPTEVIAASIPVKDAAYLTQIELTPEMDPTWRTYAPIGISTLAEIGANSVQFTPQWFFADGETALHPRIGSTPFTYKLQGMIASAKTFNLAVSLFPQVGPTDELAGYWVTEDHSVEWWQSWFADYSLFVLNYARIAANTGVDQFVLGGKAVLPAFPGGNFLDGSPTTVPDTINADWEALIAQIRAIYAGKLVWATNAQVSADPLPSFISRFDAIYVSVDAPLSSDGQTDSETISASFWNVIEEQVYLIYESTNLPIILAFGYPSTSDAIQGCLLVDEACSNDGLFLPSEVSQSTVDLDLQVSIYNNLFPIATSLDWVSGISIRGYNPVVSVMDGSSSIAGKPARDVIWYWFAGLHTIE